MLTNRGLKCLDDSSRGVFLDSLTSNLSFLVASIKSVLSSRPVGGITGEGQTPISTLRNCFKIYCYAIVTFAWKSLNNSTDEAATLGQKPNGRKVRLHMLAPRGTDVARSNDSYETWNLAW